MSGPRRGTTPTPGPRDRRELPHPVQQAAEGLGIVTAAALALLAFGWLVAAAIAWLM